MDLADLPYTIFAEIISYLAPREAIAARRLSRAVYAALTRDELCISLLLHYFPRAIESRELRLLLRRGDHALLDRVPWSRALAATARRYHHLGTATPRVTETVLAPTADRTDDHLLRGVTPWHRVLRLDDKTATFHYWDPSWTCDAAAGLLVHPVAGRRYALRDLDTGRTWPVPFTTEGRMVRRVRLNHDTLIIEWCEKQAMREDAGAHRHYATFYAVGRVQGKSDDPSHQEEDLYTVRKYAKDRPSNDDNGEARGAVCAVTFRAEWKIHRLGLLLRHQDRFFSAHNSTHYAIYIWQPSRSPWGEHEPRERLVIWEIDAAAIGGGPHIIAQLADPQLDHWGVRQRRTPTLRCLRLDDCTWDPATRTTVGHVFFVEEEHRWSAGPHSSSTPPRLHHVKSTGIPLTGGPRWVDECGKVQQPDVSQMQFCWRGTRPPGGGGGGGPGGGVVDMETWAGRCPCWRHDDFPYLTVCEANDAAAGVRFSARHCFMLETLSVHIKPRLRIHGVARPAEPRPRRPSSSSSSTTTTSKASRSNLVKQAHSSSAASREEHRQGDADEPIDEESDDMSDWSAAMTREVQFEDDAWSKLLNAGYICGDERWLVGQNPHGSITIMHF
ncbi:F-box domain-containing protein [Beauveria bassiana ARSEF 2860]|uniref:F-box domain-containing protein n=1 Tax=Beauveria bassiana (strain ARSEF 2860) TaxID=655819 RepID=J5JBN2_BEAB2|nr:F-box domain-containing protein [Beauveria bassiana ARSEF 2860]EJP61336.1 F-box domain-containing protein [Beauveria bassiana ARSEF 2860]